MANSHKQRAAEDRLMKQMGPGLADPRATGTDRSRCLAQVRIYTGSRKFGGSWAQCSKPPRAGCRTCHWHRDQE